MSGQIDGIIPCSIGECPAQVLLNVKVHLLLEFLQRTAMPWQPVVVSLTRSATKVEAGASSHLRCFLCGAFSVFHSNTGTPGQHTGHTPWMLRCLGPGSCAALTARALSASCVEHSACSVKQRSGHSRTAQLSARCSCGCFDSFSIQPDVWARWPACTQCLIARCASRAGLPDLFAYLQVHSVCFLPQVLVAGALKHVLGVAPAQEAIEISVHTMPADIAPSLIHSSADWEWGTVQTWD